jgi:hypothetical protein
VAIGPVQLLVLGFDHPVFKGEIVEELERLKQSGTVHVIDALAVYKDAAGELEVQHLSNLSDDEARELDSLVRAWDVLRGIPNDSSAALVLIEHYWAVPLRDAIVRAGGFRISDGFISPLDLVEVGLVSAADAQALHAMETRAGR